MISSERTSYEASTGYKQQKPAREEETLKTETVQIERKSFIFTLKENARGRFLRITEDVGGRRNTIIIPAPGLEDFARTLEGMTSASNEIPPRIDQILE